VVSHKYFGLLHLNILTYRCRWVFEISIFTYSHTHTQYVLADFDRNQSAEFDIKYYSYFSHFRILYARSRYYYDNEFNHVGWYSGRNAKNRCRTNFFSRDFAPGSLAATCFLQHSVVSTLHSKCYGIKCIFFSPRSVYLLYILLFSARKSNNDGLQQFVGRLAGHDYILLCKSDRAVTVLGACVPGNRVIIKKTIRPIVGRHKCPVYSIAGATAWSTGHCRLGIRLERYSSVTRL